jgi:hypothetical protein
MYLLNAAYKYMKNNYLGNMENIGKRWLFDFSYLFVMKP